MPSSSSKISFYSIVRYRVAGETKTKREAFIKRHEDEVNSRFLLKDIVYRYDDLIYPERLGNSTLLLYKVLESRKRPNRSRKVALVIQAKTDWNGAFEDTNELLFRLYLDHEVIYHVVDDKGKIKGLLDDATRIASNGENGAAGDERGYLTAADVKGLATCR